MERIRRGDLVQMIAGSERGKRGRVLRVDRRLQRVWVESLRMQSRHRKPGGAGAPGGVIEREGPIALSSVMLVDPAVDAPSRMRIEVHAGERRRVFVRSGDPVPEPRRASS